MKTYFTREELRLLKHLVEYKLDRFNYRLSSLEQMYKEDDKFDLDLEFVRERVEILKNIIHKLDQSIANK